MDNKRWYSRFGTVFWWSLAILPLIVALIQFIGFHLTFNSGITNANELVTYHSNQNGNFNMILYSYFGNGIYEDSFLLFGDYTFPPIYNMYFSLFDGVFEFGDSLIIVGLLSYMTSVAFYHVIFDFSVWIFNWIHSFFERWGCFK